MKNLHNMPIVWTRAVPISNTISMHDKTLLLQFGATTFLFHFRCRNTQGVYDKCVFDNLNIERPEYGYFCRAKVFTKKSI